jgi:hypothetical protein
MRWNPISADWLESPVYDIGPVEDAALLDEAEQCVRSLDPMASNAGAVSDWALIMQPARVGGFLINPGANAFKITSCLDAANIAYAWDPYPPQLMPMYRPGSGAVDRPFSLWVNLADRDDAWALFSELGITTSAWSEFSAPVTPDRTPEAEQYRLVRTIWMVALVYGPQIIGAFAVTAFFVALRWVALLRSAAHFARNLIRPTH